MSLNIIGYEILQGEYEGRAYHKVKLYMLEDIRKNGLGQRVVIEKVKRDLLPPTLEIILHSNVTLLYNRYGQVESLSFEN